MLANLNVVSPGAPTKMPATGVGAACAWLTPSASTAPTAAIAKVLIREFFMLFSLLNATTRQLAFMQNPDQIWILFMYQCPTKSQLAVYGRRAARFWISRRYELSPVAFRSFVSLGHFALASRLSATPA